MDKTDFATRHCLYDHQQLNAVLDRMAVQASALLAEAKAPLIVGVLRRGEPLAQMLQQRMQLLSSRTIPLSSLKVKRYDDDLTLLHPDTELIASADIAARDWRSTTALLVDDVLYQGHSLLRVASYLAAHGCRQIRSAVLVDRRVRQMPIAVDIVGVTLEVADGDVIECHVPPYENDFRIEVCRRRS